MHKLDHQLLSGEADSDEVQLLTVDGETEDDLFLSTFVNFGELWLKDARGPQRKRWWPQTDQLLRHASRINLLFANKDECQKFSDNAGWVPTPQIQENSVEAVLSLLQE